MLHKYNNPEIWPEPFIVDGEEKLGIDASLIPFSKIPFDHTTLRPFSRIENGFGETLVWQPEGYLLMTKDSSSFLKVIFTKWVEHSPLKNPSADDVRKDVSIIFNKEIENMESKRKAKILIFTDEEGAKKVVANITNIFKESATEFFIKSGNEKL